jgi:hypothetical protein
MKKSTVIILIIVTVIIVSIACCCTLSILNPYIQSLPQTLPTNQSIISQSTDTNQPSAILGHVGDTLSQGNYVIALVGVEKAKCFGEYSCAGEGKVLIAVEIIVKSAGSGVHVNPFYCKIKDSQGYEYMMSLLGKEPSLKAQNDLPIGEISRGWITFELSETATGLIFSYEPIQFLNEVRIRFDLGI